MILLKLKYEKGQKTWVAIIEGRSRQYGLAREFIGAMQNKEQAGVADYLLEDDGVYEICELGARKFAYVQKETLVEIAQDKVVRILKRRELKKRREEKKITNEIDQRIIRFNAEGGFSQN